MNFLNSSVENSFFCIIWVVNNWSSFVFCSNIVLVIFEFGYVWIGNIINKLAVFIDNIVVRGVEVIDDSNVEVFFC